MSCNHSGAKDWLKIFAMQRRIRRRLRSGNNSDEWDLLKLLRSDGSSGGHTIQQQQQQQQQPQETRTRRRLSHSNLHSYPPSADSHHRNLINGNSTPTHHSM